MKLTDLLKDIELGKVYTDKDRKPFKVNEEKITEEHTISFSKEEMAKLHKDGKLEKDGHTYIFSEGKLNEKFDIKSPGYSSKEAKNVVDGALKQYSKDLKKLQYRVVKDWMSKAKSGVIDYFDLVRGFLH